MPMNLSETIQKIKRVGQQNVRAVPMPAQNVVDGDYQIEIMENKTWRPILSGIKQRMAEDIINQAVCRVLLG